MECGVGGKLEFGHAPVNGPARRSGIEPQGRIGSGAGGRHAAGGRMLSSAFGRLVNRLRLSRTRRREGAALEKLADNMLGNARMQVGSARRAFSTADPADKRGILRLHRSLSDCGRLLADTAAQYAEAENSRKEASRLGLEADMLACGMHRHFPDRRFAQ